VPNRGIVLITPDFPFAPHDVTGDAIALPGPCPPVVGVTDDSKVRRVPPYPSLDATL